PQRDSVHEVETYYHVEIAQQPAQHDRDGLDDDRAHQNGGAGAHDPRQLDYERVPGDQSQGDERRDDARHPHRLAPQEVQEIALPAIVPEDHERHRHEGPEHHRPDHWMVAAVPQASDEHATRVTAPP